MKFYITNNNNNSSSLTHSLTHSLLRITVECRNYHVPTTRSSFQYGLRTTRGKMRLTFFYEKMSFITA